MEGFDRIATVYNFLAGLVFGRSIYRAQVHFMNKIPAHSHILMVGGGSGKTLVELFRNAKPRSLIFLDNSSQMILQARANIKKEKLPDERIDFIKGNILHPALEGRFDVVILPFILDLFKGSEVRTIIEEIQAFMNPEAIWLFTDFQIPAGRMRYPAKILLRAMYFFFRLCCGISAHALPDVKTSFREAGLSCKAEAFFFCKMIRTAVYQQDPITK